MLIHILELLDTAEAFTTACRITQLRKHHLRSCVKNNYTGVSYQGNIDVSPSAEQVKGSDFAHSPRMYCALLN